MSWLDTIETLRNKDFKATTKKERDDAARNVVNTCSYAATMVAFSPIPFSEWMLTLPIQSAMVMTVGHIYGRKVTEADAKDLIVELGTTVGLGMLARQGVKALLPMIGPLLTLPAAFAASWGIGRAAMEYFREGGGISGDKLREIFERARKEGAAIFSKQKLGQTRDDERGDGSKKKKKKKKKLKLKKKHREEQAAANDDDEDRPIDLPLSKVAKLVERDFAKLVEAHADVAKEIDGLVHLDIGGDGGGQWTIDFRKQRISRGLSGSPKMTVRCDSDELIALVRREKSAQMAVLTGALKLDPMDLELAQSVGKLFA